MVTLLESIYFTIRRTSLALILWLLSMPLLASENIPSEQSFARSIAILESSASGKTLLKRAKVKWKLVKSQDLMRILRIGSVSKTDSVLTRHYDPDTGKETRERRITIFLRNADSTYEMVLDLAHELSHALDGPSWDPYDPRLSAGRYIWESLEGRGGEVDAVFHECQVALELSRKQKVPYERCIRYLSDKGLGMERDKIKQDFYLVGKWFSDIRAKLGREEKLFPYLSDETPQLYSSTGNSPYPVALFEEYRQLTKAACQNMASRLKLDRSPASVRKQTKEFLSNRCGQSTDETTFSYSSRTQRHE